MQVTLKTIAEQTGVSISTVSRILSKDGRRRSGDTTAETVIKTAKELGYFDKGIFQFSSAKKKCHTIGCTFISDHESFVSPFFAELLAGIREEIKNQENLYELTLLTFNCTEAGFEQSLENAHLDGSIILGRTTRERVNSLKATIPHLVYAGLNRMEDMAAGLPDGPYEMGQEHIIVTDGDAQLPNGVRAGSTLTTINALQNLLAFTGRPLEDVLPLLTENPAKLMKLDNKKGTIGVGKDADLLLLDGKHEIILTLVKGKTTYQRSTI